LVVVAGFEPTTLGYADAHNNLGSALKDQNRLDEALYSYNKATSLSPDYADAYVKYIPAKN
jgi:tetratricopeptide (TPR) repeat protein